MKTGNLSFGENKKLLIMGILNVTPDSFSDGGLYMDTDEAVSHALLLGEQGADIIDIGGESTRPGFTPVSADEELTRVIPVIMRLRELTDIPLSIDTTKASVAEEALKLGCSLVNDISGAFNIDLARIISSFNASLCITHNSTVDMTAFRIDPDTCVNDINQSLKSVADSYIAEGVNKDNIIIDPGIGFTKSNEVSAYILQHLSDFGFDGYPRLLGCSGKSVFKDMFGFKPDERGEAGLCATLAAYRAEYDIVRVHDVASHRRFLTAALSLLC